MGTVELCGRVVNRVGLSVTQLRATGMWGEPADRGAAVAAIRRAVELGVDVIEVPLPFGPAADLVRQANVRPAFIAVRLTSRVPDLRVVARRLGGRRPDLVLADQHLLADMEPWGVPLGALVGPRDQTLVYRPLAAVRGPLPAPWRILERCEEGGVPYMASSLAVLAAGARTIALASPRGVADVERLFAESPTPPAAGPG